MGAIRVGLGEFKFQLFFYGLDRFRSAMVDCRFEFHVKDYNVGARRGRFARTSNSVLVSDRDRLANYYALSIMCLVARLTKCREASFLIGGRFRNSTLNYANRVSLYGVLLVLLRRPRCVVDVLARMFRVELYWLGFGFYLGYEPLVALLDGTFGVLDLCFVGAIGIGLFGLLCRYSIQVMLGIFKDFRALRRNLLRSSRAVKR